MRMTAKLPRGSVLVLVLLATTGCASRERAEENRREERPVLATPTIERDEQGRVLLSTPDGAGEIRYSLDGTEPDARAGKYLAPIDLAHGGLVRARTFTTDRKWSSDPAEASFPPLDGTTTPTPTRIAVTQDRDWPLYDWSIRHRETIAHARAAGARIVFLGDSITHMFGGPPHDRPQPGQPVWERAFAGYAVANSGFGYDRIENVLWRVQHGALDSLDVEVVVLNIGTNNLQVHEAEEIVTGIEGLLAVIRAKQPRARIVLMGLFPRGPAPDELRAEIATVNARLAMLADDDVAFLDLTSDFLREDGSLPRELMSDFLHPTAAGYEIWARALLPWFELWTPDR